MKLNNQDSLSLRVVVDAWRHHSIAPNPEYQRGRAWKLDQQKLLIDSALRGYPLPRFYLSQDADVDPLGNPTTSLQVIDGLQRILSFAEYMDDKWPLFDPAKARSRFPRAVAEAPCPWAERRYSELPPETRARLDAIRLPVVIIESLDSPDELRDLFIRLQAGTALTRQQIRDAWPGTMSEYVERIGGKLSRRGRFEFLSNLDRRGSWRDDGDELDDSFHDGRQTAAQLLRLFLDRRRSWALGGADARALDDLYRAETDFDPEGPLAREYERVLRLAEEVVATRAPMTSGGSRAKVQKPRLFALFVILAGPRGRVRRPGRAGGRCDRASVLGRGLVGLRPTREGDVAGDDRGERALVRGDGHQRGRPDLP